MDELRGCQERRPLPGDRGERQEELEMIYQYHGPYNLIHEQGVRLEYAQIGYYCYWSGYIPAEKRGVMHFRPI